VEDSGEQRPSSAHVGFLADEAPALLQPWLQDTRLVGSTSGGRYSLMDEDQLSLGVDVLPAEREKFLGSYAAEEGREDERPVPRRNRVEEAAGLLGWDPAAFGARASGLRASVGEIYARAERWVDFDAVLAERVAEDRRQAADRAVDGGLRETALQQGALDVVQVPSGDPGEWAILAARKVGVDVRLDPIAVGLDGPRIPPDARRPDAHPLPEREPAFGGDALVQLGDALFGCAAGGSLGRVSPRSSLAVVGVAIARAPAGDLPIGVADGDRSNAAGDADLGARPAAALSHGRPPWRERPRSARPRLVR
jgi:hypothetical protein